MHTGVGHCPSMTGAPRGPLASPTVTGQAAGRLSGLGALGALAFEEGGNLEVVDHVRAAGG